MGGGADIHRRRFGQTRVGGRDHFDFANLPAFIAADAHIIPTAQAAQSSEG